MVGEAEGHAIGPGDAPAPGEGRGAFVEMGLNAPLDLIAQRAGCRATELSGQPLRFNAARPMADGMVVAPPRLHGQMIAGLGPAGSP